MSTCLFVCCVYCVCVSALHGTAHGNGWSQGKQHTPRPRGKPLRLCAKWEAFQRQNCNWIWIWGHPQYVRHLNGFQQKNIPGIRVIPGKQQHVPPGRLEWRQCLHKLRISRPEMSRLQPMLIFAPSVRATVCTPHALVWWWIALSASPLKCAHINFYQIKVNAISFINRD